MDALRATLTAGLAQWHVPVTAEQLNACTRYAELLVQWNEKMNLTRIVDPTEMAVKHFLDSAAVLHYVHIEHGASLIDVGTGAGFPGLVLAILRPDLHITLLDSLNKRLLFLQAVTDELGVTNTRLHHARAEDGGRDTALREKFTVAVARAVAELRVLAEYALPFVQPGGKLIAWKGPNVEDECRAAAGALQTLGGTPAQHVSFVLPGTDAGRTFVWSDKKRPTPKRYPRKAGEPNRRPLGVSG